jgi:uncharacterized repeat protein (TIGR04076 family)
VALFLFSYSGGKRMYDLRVTVEEVKGFCDLPMKPGDYFEIRGSALVLPEGGHICFWALQSLMPFLAAKQRASEDPNDWLPRTSKLICPDPNGGVIYRIERIGEKKKTEAKKTKASSVSRRIRLVADPDICSGCKACEMACSAFHGGAYSPELSRVRIDSEENTCTDVPRICHQCGSAACVRACPVGALERNEETGGLILHEDKCVACGACARACPFGALNLSRSTGKPLVCDLCGGDPMCVKRCPTGALKAVPMEDL